jgi:hypothetical protein
VILYGVGDSPTIAMTAPVSAENLTEGTTKVITWVATGTTNPVDINLYKGLTLVKVIASSASNTGSYTWGVTANGYGTAATYRIQVVDTEDSQVNGVTSYFTITVPSEETPTTDRPCCCKSIH